MKWFFIVWIFTTSAPGAGVDIEIFHFDTEAGCDKARKQFERMDTGYNFGTITWTTCFSDGPEQP